VAKKKLYLIIGACALALLTAVFFSGFAVGRRGTGDTGDIRSGSELYTDSLVRIGELEGELEQSERLNEQLTTELGDLKQQLDKSTSGIVKVERGIIDSQGLVDTSLEISGDIGDDSRSLGDIIGESAESAAAIETASRGLADIFGVEGKTD
jgi:hypothetical protein